MSLVMRILNKHNICTLLETKDKSNRNNDFIKKTYKENKRLQTIIMQEQQTII